MSLNNISVQVNGNSSVIAASDSTYATQLIITTNAGSLPGAFYVLNTGPNVAWVNFDYTGTANVAVAGNLQDGRGIPVAPDFPVVVNLAQGFNYTPQANIYVTSATAAGTAQVYFTPVA